MVRKIIANNRDKKDLPVSLKLELLISELLGDISGRRSGDLDPGLGEESTRSEDKADVDQAGNGIGDNLRDGSRRRDVVSETTSGNLGTGSFGRPLSEEVDEQVGPPTSVQQLGEEVQIRHEGGLEDDRDVGGIEQLDGVGSLLTSDLGRERGDKGKFLREICENF